MQSNYTSLLDTMDLARTGHAHMRDMDTNVDRMKGWLMDRIGTTWAQATRWNSESELEISRGKVLWEEMRETMSQRGDDAVPAFVASKVRGLTSNFYRFL